MNTKKEIKELIGTVPEDILEGELFECAEKLKNPRNYIGTNGKPIQKLTDYSRFELKWEYYGYDGGKDLIVNGVRMETDFEYLNRLAKEEKDAIVKVKRKTAQEEKERKQYEKLKAKFGK